MTEKVAGIRDEWAKEKVPTYLESKRRTEVIAMAMSFTLCFLKLPRITPSDPITVAGLLVQYFQQSDPVRR